MNHKIKINNIEVELTEEQIRELHSRLQNKGEKYFFPEKYDKYYFMDRGVSSCTNEEDAYDEARIPRGVFRTKEQAIKEDEKQKALVRMWKWVQENGLYFEPNWESDIQLKYYPFFCYYNIKKGWNVFEASQNQTNFLFPHFKSKQDCQKFIDNNLSDLNLFVQI